MITEKHLEETEFAPAQWVEPGGLQDLDELQEESD